MAEIETPRRRTVRLAPAAAPSPMPESSASPRVLAAYTVQRLGGTLQRANRPNRGACAEIKFPLAGLAVA